MKKKLAIIGANDSILPLIQKAKSLNYETHVFAWKKGTLGEEIADFFYPISISEKERILRICSDISISGITSITSDYAIETVNYIARTLGLPCNEEKTETVSRNKYHMRCEFQKAGLYTPNFQLVEKKDLIKWKDVTFPGDVIIKPTDRWSSKGVTRVTSNCSVYEALQKAIELSMGDAAIIEEYMYGSEYSAECIIQDGKNHILSYTQKETTGFPHYIETGHIQPADINETQIPFIQTVINRSIYSLGIKNSAAHVEFKILPDNNVGIIEIGSRMGGDHIGTDLTPISTGMDFIKMVIDVACGNELDFSVIKEPHAVQIRYIISQDDLYQYEEYKKHHSDSIISIGEMDYNFTEVTDSSSRHGYYIFLR